MKRCPTDCGRAVQAGHLLCGACWRRVPPALRSEVHRCWRRWRRDLGDADAMHAYTDAADAATAAARR